MRSFVFFALGFGAAVGTAFSADDSKYTKKHGDWLAIATASAMTDEKVCVAQYSKDSNIIYTSSDKIEIDYSRRGGVDNYQYRFGKSHPSEIAITQSYEKEKISVPVLVLESLDQGRLLIQGATVLKAPINLDVSLKGLKEARADIASKCEMNDMRSIANGAPDWATWQATPSTTPLKK
ncbi:hypothetical protein HNP33_003698 [Comamonas odontotermitis]|uniref:Uncharacterized protein n=1 Tax=Comamonas odontotermitis TaxID=379895 RepID=A0ABR6RK79_9BURK|nr:hypothetical protein [Comamonas odontotermitis]MBB6579584.1 hypothetical protein [Comamonas odontotermitis]